MKIYVITSGEYSDYHIDAIFLNEEKAEEYIRLYPNCVIEEYEPFDDDFEIGKYEIKKYLVVNYQIGSWNNNKEGIDFYIGKTNTREYNDLKEYPYNYRKYSYYDWSDSHAITIYKLVDDDFTIDKLTDDIKQKYLKICRDYVAKAKSLHDIEGYSYEDIEKTLFDIK